MTVYLKSIDDRLDLRLVRMELAHKRIVESRSRVKRVDRFALQEGLISSLWQTWCDACRSIVLNSAKGALTTSGVHVTSSYSPYTIDEIRFASMRFSRQEPVNPNRLTALRGDYLEPTWGDFSKLQLVIVGLDPTNSTQLLSSLGTYSSIRDLQTTRNACAHLGADSILEIRQLAPRYNNASFEHPSDVIFWRVPGLDVYSWRLWLLEIKNAIRSAVM